MQNAGEAKKDKATLEKEASHATAKLGPISASSSGAVTKDDPNRQEGAWNQTVGSGKETLGNLVGSEVSSLQNTIPQMYTCANVSCQQNLKREGAEQNAAGKGQEAQGQLNDFGSGVANRVSGAVGGAVAGITGDRQAAQAAQDKHDVGKTQQRGAEHDIQKQNA